MLVRKKYMLVRNSQDSQMSMNNLCSTMQTEEGKCMLYSYNSTEQTEAAIKEGKCMLYSHNSTVFCSNLRAGI
jgi:hypothetical protein